MRVLMQPDALESERVVGRGKPAPESIARMSDKSANLIAMYLAERDERCPVCKYNLRGVQSEKCPECGAGLNIALQVGSPPRHNDGWLLAGLLGLSIATLFISAFLGFSLYRVTTMIQSPQVSQMVAAGYMPASALPNWGAVVRLAFCTSVFVTAWGLLATARWKLRTVKRRTRIIIGLCAAFSPMILMFLLWAMFGS